MGTRIKNFDSTGVAPNGRLYAGDLNAIEDQYADQNNLGQTLGLGVAQIGEVGLQLLRYGAGEARLSGALRADGIMRGLGGIYAGAYTTAQRDAISSANRPYGLIILNTTTNRLEINLGSSTTPSWQSLGGSTTAFGTFGARPSAGVTNAGTFYVATDVNGGTLYYSDGANWSKVAPGLSEQMTPADNTVTSAKIVDASIGIGDLGAGVGGKDFGTNFPNSGLYTGYRFVYQNSNGRLWDFMYRPDLDGTYPWQYIGGPPLFGDSTGNISVYAPRTGFYHALASVWTTSGSGAVSFDLYAGGSIIVPSVQISLNGSVAIDSEGMPIEYEGVVGAGSAMTLALSHSVARASLTVWPVKCA